MHRFISTACNCSWAILPDNIVINMVKELRVSFVDPELEAQLAAVYARDDDADAFAKMLARLATPPSHTTIRVNTLRTSREQLIADLRTLLHAVRDTRNKSTNRQRFNTVNPLRASRMERPIPCWRNASV